MDSNKIQNTSAVVSVIKKFDVDIYGIADLSGLKDIPSGFNIMKEKYSDQYSRAIVLGAQWRKFGDNTSGHYVDLFLEKAALEITSFIFEKEGFGALTIHPEDEFDTKNRIGFLSLKVLAKAAGLGWQGRSLLTVSPKYGPLHRLIAILTDMPLQTDKPIHNQCGGCTDCIDQCPVGALTLVEFDDHPDRREDVLDISTCLGDNECTICIESCPWLK